MPFFLVSDTHADDPIWEVLGGGRLPQIDAVQAAWGNLMAKASLIKGNGYLTRSAALEACRGRKRLLDALTRSVLDRPPRLHRRGDECECLAGSEWIEGYEYRLHAFLRRNPSRREYDRNRAQKADLRDKQLRDLVYARDGGCCRYCRSGPLNPKAARARDRRRVLQFDHVDPDASAGPEGVNFVTSCARCNEHKGHRTPDEADMVLLPVPTDAERAEWAARPEEARRLDRPTADQRQINDETPTDHHRDGDQVADPITDPPNGSSTPDTDTAGDDARPDQVNNGDDQRRARPAQGLGWGGQPAPGQHPPASIREHPDRQPDRPPVYPDVYHRRSRYSPPSTPPTDSPGGRP
jgi:5-methylcytosine-specific restriction endonuclease McrA